MINRIWNWIVREWLQKHEQIHWKVNSFVRLHRLAYWGFPLILSVFAFELNQNTNISCQSEFGHWFLCNHLKLKAELNKFPIDHFNKWKYDVLIFFPEHLSNIPFNFDKACVKFHVHLSVRIIYLHLIFFYFSKILHG